MHWHFETKLISIQHFFCLRRVTTYWENRELCLNITRNKNKQKFCKYDLKVCLVFSLVCNSRSLQRVQQFTEIKERLVGLQKIKLRQLDQRSDLMLTAVLLFSPLSPYALQVQERRRIEQIARAGERQQWWPARERENRTDAKKCCCVNHIN